MEVTIKIETRNIAGLYVALTVLRNQVIKSCQKQQLDHDNDVFKPEDSNSLSDDDHYGTCNVNISNK